MTVLSITPKPTATEEVRASVIGILENALKEAKDGNITSVLVIALHPDGEWSDWHSSTEQTSEMVGRLEIAKINRIKRFLD